MIRFALAVALVATAISASGTAALDAEPPHADVWFYVGQGVDGHYTVDFSQPYPFPADPWRKVTLYAGHTMVIHADGNGDVTGDGRVGLEEAVHALRVASGN